MSDLKNEIKRLSNLKNYKKYDKNKLERIAQINVWKKQANIASKFENSKEKELGEDYLNNYLNNYEFSTYSDVQNIADLVFEEVLKNRIQNEIDKIINNEKTNFVPDKMIQSLHSVEEKIWSLKEKLGIVGQKEQNDLTALKQLEKKFKLYIAHNRNEFTCYLPVNCPKCGNKDVQSILLRRRVKDFEALKHPFLSGRFLYNRRGMELVKANIWTKEQYAWVFHTSVKYVDWCINNEHKILEIDDVAEKEIQEFINNTDYLKKEKISKKILNDKKK